MDYDDELESFEEEAEDRYDDYDDYDDDGHYEDEDDFDSGLEGIEEYEEYDDDDELEYLPAMDGEYEEDSYDSYKATSIGRIDPNDRTLTITVTNTSGAPAEAIVFGAYQSSPQVAGVQVICAESSHQEVRNESMSNPFRISGLKMLVSDPAQFGNVLKITNRTAAGSKTTRVFQPSNGLSPQNHAQNLIDLDSWEMDVTGQDSLQFLINDGITVVFTFTIRARANMGNLLKGNNVAEMSTTPRTTGLPQLDLLRKRRPRAFGKRPRKRVRKVIRRRPKRVRMRRRPRRLLRRRR